MCGVGWEVRLCYMSWSDGVSVNLSQMCGSWYFPHFLLNEESLTHIYIVLFMFLVIPCDALLIMVKQWGLTGYPWSDCADVGP